MQGQLFVDNCLKLDERGSIALSPKFVVLIVGGIAVEQIVGNGGHVVVTEMVDDNGSETVGVDMVGNVVDWVVDEGISLELSSVVIFGWMNEMVNAVIGVDVSIGSEVVVIGGVGMDIGITLIGFSLEG